MSDKGRWFRLYALQLRDHRKFRSLNAVEIGAWVTLRSEAELRAGAVITDRAEAVLILKRRKVPRPGAVLDRLVELALFDVDAEGRFYVHDRADHDRPQYPSDAPDAVAERQRKSRESHEKVTTRDGDSHDTHAGVQPQHSAPATANSPSTQPQPREGLPTEDDSATAACRMFVNGGRWLGDSEYVAAWDDLDHRYTAAWVGPEIQPAYTEMHLANPKVKPWNLVRAVELRCAERSRSEERKREDVIAEANRKESEGLRLKAESATDEEKRRASIMRRAVGLWLRKRPSEPVPTDFDQLSRWLEQNGAPA